MFNRGYIVDAFYHDGYFRSKTLAIRLFMQVAIMLVIVILIYWRLSK